MSDNLILHSDQTNLDLGLNAAFADDSFNTSQKLNDLAARDTGLVIDGKFKLLEIIGIGGMGTVWLAEQFAPVQRNVAIKLINPGMDSNSVLQRFMAERQALALMDHANIAKVFDGGVTETGRPYFVMEWVPGMPITEFCDQHRLSPCKRLLLFVPVCQAIQHAHQKGIIHRDIKPSNVLVATYDETPIVKVIDFGVAKAMKPANGDLSIQTGLNQLVGTPEYMSPEQASPDCVDVDTRADIYSLGILLYELLVGSPPFRKREILHHGLSEMMRMISQDNPPLPSWRFSTSEQCASIASVRSISPASLTRLLRSDLDWVVMKAIERDRQQRYQTASGLARDLQRFLDDEPVEACPSTKLYRLRKLSRKYRGLWVSSFLVLFLLIVGTCISSWQAYRAIQSSQLAAERRLDAESAMLVAETERDKSEKARTRMREVLDAMTSSVTENVLTRQTSLTAEQKSFLEKVLDYYSEFAGESGNTEIELRAADACVRIAVIQSRLGSQSSSMKAWRLAIERFGDLAEKNPENLDFSCRLANCLNDAALQFVRNGDHEEGLKMYEQALIEMEQLCENSPGDPSYWNSLARLKYNRAMRARDDGGDVVESTNQLIKARKIYDRIDADFPSFDNHWQGMGLTYVSLGMLLSDQGRWDEGEPIAMNGLGILERMETKYPDLVENRLMIPWSLNNIALRYSAAGKLEVAIMLTDRSVGLLKKISADYPTVPDYSQQLIIAYNNQAGFYLHEKEFEKAEQHLRDAIILAEKISIQNPSVHEYRFHLGHAWGLLSRLCQKTDRLAEARAACDSQLQAFEAVVSVLDSMQQLYEDRELSLPVAFARASGLKPSQSDEYWKRAIEIQQQIDSRNSVSPDNATKRLGALLYERAVGGMYSGHVEDSIADLEKLIDGKEWNGCALYEFACVYGVACENAEANNRIYADQAIGFLRKAIDAGWSNHTHLSHDVDLESIHDRIEFQELLNSISEKQERAR